MCYNCGCDIPQDNMGSVDNITDDTFKDLADHWGVSIDEAKLKVLKLIESQELSQDSYAENIFIQATKAWGQSKDEAVKNTKGLLKKQLKVNA